VAGTSCGSLEWSISFVGHSDVPGLVGKMEKCLRKIPDSKGATLTKDPTISDGQGFAFCKKKYFPHSYDIALQF
jgi:hypothetical protein